MEQVENIIILGGEDKSGKKEEVQVEIKRGDVISIVGPTGSGKSRLLGDIECLANGDTPTRRVIKVNGMVADQKVRRAFKNKLIAQLSQNMNFVMDISAQNFISIHAGVRNRNGVEMAAQLVGDVLEMANELSGEPFTGDTPVTQLSGGQSRALMIADTALLSPAPVVLIDEIENAGIDRKKAIELLVRREKIVLMSTHDPILALFGQKRLVMKNGSISAVLETLPKERENLTLLEAVDEKMLKVRETIRLGKRIDNDLREDFYQSLHI